MRPASEARPVMVALEHEAYCPLCGVLFTKLVRPHGGEAVVPWGELTVCYGCRAPLRLAPGPFYEAVDEATLTPDERAGLEAGREVLQEARLRRARLH